VTELTQRLCKTEVSLQANIHDYLSLRAQTLQSTRHMQEQLVAANCTRDDALLKLAEMQVPPRARARCSLPVVHHMLRCSARARLTSEPPFKTLAAVTK
jgi:hypothetical protein